MVKDTLSVARERGQPAGKAPQNTMRHSACSTNAGRSVGCLSIGHLPRVFRPWIHWISRVSPVFRIGSQLGGPTGWWAPSAWPFRSG